MNLKAWDYILYKNDENLYIGQIIKIINERNKIEVNPEFGIGVESWYTDTRSLNKEDIIKKLPKLVGLEQQITKHYPQYLI